jgi:hypothetical protein
VEAGKENTMKIKTIVQGGVVAGPGARMCV